MVYYEPCCIRLLRFLATLRWWWAIVLLSNIATSAAANNDSAESDTVCTTPGCVNGTTLSERFFIPNLVECGAVGQLTILSWRLTHATISSVEVEVNWGDGGATESLEAQLQSGWFLHWHVYLTAGNYTPQVDVDYVMASSSRSVMRTTMPTLHVAESTCVVAEDEPSFTEAFSSSAPRRASPWFMSLVVLATVVAAVW
jgi:hypothetical protein